VNFLLAFQDLQAAAHVGRFEYPVAFEAEQSGQELAEAAFVVEDEDGCGHGVRGAGWVRYYRLFR